jgi:hypothetical protein
MAKSNRVPLVGLPPAYRRPGDVQTFIQRPEVVDQAKAIARQIVARRQADAARRADRRASDRWLAAEFEREFGPTVVATMRAVGMLPRR